MRLFYELQAPKKAVNLSVNEDLLAQAKYAGINLSATFEQALVQALQQQRREQWLADKRDAIAAYNEQVERHGSFGDGVRGFRCRGSWCIAIRIWQAGAKYRCCWKCRAT